MAKDKNPLDGVVKFISTEGWNNDLAAVLTEHTGAACEKLGIDPAALVSMLDQQVYGMMFTCVVEDLMSRTGADGRNVTDVFVKRHGWKLGTTVKRQLEALRQSKSALYEIAAVSPGSGLSLKDLLAPETTVDVLSPGLAGALPVGCPIGMRIMTVDGKATPSGGILPFEQGMSEEAAAYVRQASAGSDNLAPHISAIWIIKTIEEQRAGGDSARTEDAEALD
jgi:hypothetical protein